MAEQPPTQKCENCRYFYGPIDSHMRCRRYPKVPSDDPHVHVNWRHPLAGVSEWCGERQSANPETLPEGAPVLIAFVQAGDLTAARALADKLRE